MRITTQFESKNEQVIPTRDICDADDKGDLVTFDESSKKICVGIVDVVGSTRITARLTNQNLAKYYGTFLNTLGSVVVRFHGRIVKNIGDSILYYFPEGTTKSQFVRCLECNLTMLRAHAYLNAKLRGQGLPQLDYRISSDYGSVAIANTSLMAEDIFGQPVNVCAKINSLARPNSFVIGSDFYEVVKSLECYRFVGTQSYSSGLKNSYPVYSVSYDDSKIKKVLGRCIEKTLMQIGTAELEAIVSRLFDKYGCLLSDCYGRPECLKDVLTERYGNASVAIEQKIEQRLDDCMVPKTISKFVLPESRD